jgi:ankyrin repeat protein
MRYMTLVFFGMFFVAYIYMLLRVFQNGSTPFHWAAANCHLDIVETLLAANADIDAQDQHGLTALLWAADLGHLEVIQCLIKNNANLHAVDEVRWLGPHVLFWLFFKMWFLNCDLFIYLFACGQ